MGPLARLGCHSHVLAEERTEWALAWPASSMTGGHPAASTEWELSACKVERVPCAGLETYRAQCMRLRLPAFVLSNDDKHTAPPPSSNADITPELLPLPRPQTQQGRSANEHQQVCDSSDPERPLSWTINILWCVASALPSSDAKTWGITSGSFTSIKDLQTSRAFQHLGFALSL